jgi:hypothetical protein
LIAILFFIKLKKLHSIDTKNAFWPSRSRALESTPLPVLHRASAALVSGSAEERPNTASTNMSEVNKDYNDNDNISEDSQRDINNEPANGLFESFKSSSTSLKRSNKEALRREKAAKQRLKMTSLYITKGDFFSISISIISITLW